MATIQLLLYVFHVFVRLLFYVGGWSLLVVACLCTFVIYLHRCLINKICSRPHMAEILLKLALNTNQS